MVDRVWIETTVIHSSRMFAVHASTAAKTDRLEHSLLMRFPGMLRGEADLVEVVAIRTIEEEDPSGRAVNRETLSARTRIIIA